MSRSGYSDDGDCDNWAWICYRGAVVSAMNGARGQKLLRDLIAALDAMPVKELIANELEAGGQVCALGALGKVRGMDMTNLNPEAPKQIGKAFDIAPSLAREIVFENDDSEMYSIRVRTPAERWAHMRAWASSQLVAPERAPA